MTKEQDYIASLREDNAVLRNRVTDLTRERDEYKIWWERDSTSLGKALNELRFLRAVNEDSRAQIERLKEILTCPQLTPEARADQFKAVLDQAEKGEPVNSLDLIDALWWRVRNQRREIAKLHEKRRSHEPLERRTHGVSKLALPPSDPPDPTTTGA